MVVAPDLRSLFEEPPYGPSRGDREARLLDELSTQHTRHYEHCALFRKICDTWNWQPNRRQERLSDLPFLYAQAFKYDNVGFASAVVVVFFFLGLLVPQSLLCRPISPSRRGCSWRMQESQRERARAPKA